MSEEKRGSAGAAAAALTAIIEALEPLSPEERDRTVNAVTVFFGIAKAPTVRNQKIEEQEEADEQVEVAYGVDSDYSPRIIRWMQQNGVSSEALDRMFHFHDGTFDIHDVPGKSKKEQTLNTYILTGLGKYLATGEREFDDAVARQFCETIGCYDQANHAAHLKNRGPEYSGDKGRGYSLTNIGIKRGAALVKELSQEEAW